MPFVSITRLRVRALRFLPMFFVEAYRAGNQAGTAAGNLGTLVLREKHRTFWTSSVWTDEAAMRAYMLANPHRNAMRKLLNWCDEASIAHWTQDGPELPTWEVAHARLLAEGRKSKVYHPTEAHNAHILPPPVVSPRNQLRFP